MLRAENRAIVHRYCRASPLALLGLRLPLKRTERKRNQRQEGNVEPDSHGSFGAKAGTAYGTIAGITAPKVTDI